MGRDKALLPYEGTAMAAHVAAALRTGGCDPVLAIGGDSCALAQLGLTTVPDLWPGEGPLGGVITALQHFADHDVVVIAACDLPRVSASTVAALIGALVGATDVAMAVTGRAQPLCAAWRPKAASNLSAAFADGTRRILDALAGLQVIEVAVDAGELINVNTADDLPG
ncbi:molybdenum cofactor guanylyltransferase [soil metagenome]